MPTLMRIAEVVKATGYSKSSIYRLIKERKFPGPVHPCDGRASGWVDEEVHGVIEDAIARRDGKAV